MRSIPLSSCLLSIYVLFSGCTPLDHNPSEKQNIPFDATNPIKTNDPYHFKNVKEPTDKVNFLIVGVDSRGEKHSRSDAIMIAQLHKKSHNLRLVSIMRDSYVNIPHPNTPYKKNKINAAYYLGGPELLRKTIEENFHLDIHHYIEIDFQGFVQVVDLLTPEGIVVNLTQDIISDMNMGKQPGKQNLHGQELLAYARFRHDTQSDFGRITRQQEVLLALKKQLTANMTTIEGMMIIPKVARELSQYISTDLSLDEMIFFASDLALNSIKNIETMRIPVENGFVNKRVKHVGLVLELKEELNQAAVNAFLIEAPEPVNQN